MGKSCDKPCCSGGRKPTEEEIVKVILWRKKHKPSN